MQISKCQGPSILNLHQKKSHFQNGDSVVVITVGSWNEDGVTGCSKGPSVGQRSGSGSPPLPLGDLDLDAVDGPLQLQTVEFLRVTPGPGAAAGCVL